MGGVDGTEAAFVRVEVMSTGTATQSAILKDDADKVAQIYHTVQSSFVNSSGGNKESVNDKAEDDALKDYSQSGTTNLSSGFRIIFTTEDKYNLERRSDPASDSTIGFLNACDKYTAEYFENQILVMVLLEEGSGSIRHNVDNVKYGSDGKLYVSVRRDVPEAGTDDMAEWHILIEPEKDIAVANESDIVVYLDGVNQKTKPNTVYESGPYSNITLTIPYDWEYTTGRGNNPDEYCISFWPADQTEGKIEIWYYTAFGVCGTGLEEKEITVGEYEAWQGTYDNKKVWDFISFRGMPGSYVAMNEGADKWWNRYGDEAMQILGTVKIADGIISKSQAIEIAKKGITAKYDRTDAIFDSEKGLWTVSFYEKNRSEKVQSITVSYNGKVINKEAAK